MNYKILISVILVAGITIIAYSVSIGIMKRDIVVEESPYDAGLAYEDTMRRYATLGWTADIPGEMPAGTRQLKVSLFDRDKKPIEDATMECLVNENAQHTSRRVSCASSGRGLYQCDFDLNSPGYRDVRIKVSRAADEMIFHKQIILAK